MTTSPMINAILVFAAFGAGCFMYWGWLREQAIAEFRASLFQLRRELFLLMAEGQIDAKDPAYVHLRNSLNGLLRGAHRLSLGQVIFTHAVAKTEGLEFPDTFETKLRSVTEPATAKELRRIHGAVRVAILMHMKRTAKFSVLFPVLVWFHLQDNIGRAARYVRLAEAQGIQFEAGAVRAA